MVNQNPRRYLVRRWKKVGDDFVDGGKWEALESRHRIVEKGELVIGQIVQIYTGKDAARRRRQQIRATIIYVEGAVGENRSYDEARAQQDPTMELLHDIRNVTTETRDRVRRVESTTNRIETKVDIAQVNQERMLEMMKDIHDHFIEKKRPRMDESNELRHEARNEETRSEETRNDVPTTEEATNQEPSIVIESASRVSSGAESSDYETFLREMFGWGESCRERRCTKNKEGDPFCLCCLLKSENEEFLRKLNVPRGHGGKSLPRGIYNLGSTCYMNVVLQVLFSIGDVRRAIIGFDERTRNDPMNHDLVKAMKKLFVSLTTTTSHACWAHDVATAMGVDVRRQQDAPEFLSKLLEAIDKQLGGDGDTIGRVFKGKMCTTTKCQTCGIESTTNDVFNRLTLPVDGVSSIDAGLNVYFEAEAIENYSCNECGPGQIATKSVKIHEAPKVLILQLMRYGTDPVTGLPKKLATPISYVNAIGLEQYTDGESRGRNERYYLKAVANHTGTITSGHYDAHIRCDRGQWYTFNDTAVTKYVHKGVRDDFGAVYFLVYETADLVARHLHTIEEGEEEDEEMYNLDDVQAEMERRRVVASDIIDKMRAKEGRPIIWLPTEWIKHVVGAIETPGQTPPPDMEDNECVHGQIMLFDGIKATDAEMAERIFAELEVEPIPRTFYGTMICFECMKTGGALIDENEQNAANGDDI